MTRTARLAAMTFAVALGFGQGAQAEGGAPTGTASIPSHQTLAEMVHIGPLMQVVATEGARHGRSLEGQLFPGKGGADWDRTVARIQSPARLEHLVRESLNTMLREDDRTAARAFFESKLGQRIAAREVDARRAMLDQDVEGGARLASTALHDQLTPRAVLIEDLIEGLDLLSANVSGGLNANLAFYRGLLDGGAMSDDMDEAGLLSLVLSQEDDIRAATQTWLRAYMMLAYAPLSDDELGAYLAFGQTDAGRRFNAAMFEGFGRVFEATSYDLGREAARIMVRTDI
ncbi:hypothetical protein [Jannaschia sp. 2305UL9-9]|uniref:hypothetical protein n=1 Tax=Jannaschia sp. 2305UL9-9 TaxID=3121638 RepID=UPI0035287E36